MGKFVGMPLNIDTVRITPEILALIAEVAEVDEFKGAWKALGVLAPERLSALRRIAAIESIGSSTRIEGSKLSDSDVEKLMLNIESNTSKLETSRKSQVTQKLCKRFSTAPPP